MATVTIPSPSAFLTSPVLEAPPAPQVSIKANSKKRVSATSKARKASALADNATAKPKQTKSRDGCKNCKEKRLKCDETKPTCVQCEKKGVACKGYEKVLKWRPQEDAFRNKTSPAQTRKGCPPATSPQPRPARPLTPNRFPPATENTFPISPLHPSSIPRESCSTPSNYGLDDQSFAMDPVRVVSIKAEGQNARSVLDNGLMSPTPTLTNGGYEEDTTPQSARTIASNLWPEGSPRMTSVISRQRDLMSHSINQPRCSLMEEHSFDSRITKDPPPYDGEEEEVEEIYRELDPRDYWLVPAKSPTSSDSSGSSSSSWVDAFAATVWAQPKMRYDSEETLMLRFDKQTCGILSIKDGPSENPWRTMLWPLAREEGALRHAITSLTAFHASKDSPKLRIQGIEHMNQSLQLLSRSIKSMPLTTSLATTLVLAFCESWDILISTGIRHLQGASHLVAEIMRNYREGTTVPENEPHLGFLCRTWVYMDVIARLTSLEGDDSTDFDIVTTPICQVSINHNELDPLMGCASTLFPTIGRVANLIRGIRQRTQSNSFQIISQAKDLQSVLEKWKPPPLFKAPEDHWTEVEQGLWTAEAYRGATLLYLLQAVPEISYESVTETIHTLAKEVLTHIANVPVTSGMVIIHIFPLLAAGCEAFDQESRTFVLERWQAMIRRMKIQNLDRCLDVVKEVWDRRDNSLFESQRRKARLAAPRGQVGCLPMTVMKRKFNSDEDDVLDSPDGFKRRATPSAMHPGALTLKPGLLKRESTSSINGLDQELMVRGRHHWAGVMKDFRWEVLIG